jgi:hypothetical protein
VAVSGKSLAAQSAASAQQSSGLRLTHALSTTATTTTNEVRMHALSANRPSGCGAL